MKWLAVITIFVNFTGMNAQHNTEKSACPDARQESLAVISALTATGNTEQLSSELGNALDAGLTINEIKEALVQLYAYCGFPRSLNALMTFKDVLEEREAHGIKDKQGPEIVENDSPGNKYEQGRQVLETLTGRPQTRPAPGFGTFAPRIDTFLKEHLFADIFSSDVLSYRQRELVTIAALAAMPGTQSQLQAHIGMGMHTCLTAEELQTAFRAIETFIGKKQAGEASAILSQILQQQ